ncbi:RraA family protein [uncultured Planococcus sp.]|uniref:RraA family protein n=1 Tax=uncultured Planococcus sp. TaxID=337815 RepID=UPI002609FDC6|nr:RraA family protein [uncultured Planococcus sp.]
MANQSLIEQYKSIPTTAISDAMEGLNNLDSSIKPLKDTYKISGKALTVKMPIGDNYSVMKALDAAEPGDIIVIDAKGDLSRAVAGDFVIGMAKTLGIAGFVVDGAIRDLEACKALDFPIFCKGTTMAAGNKAGQGEINTAISCGGVSVQSGDIIVGDCDGVTVIPQESAQKVLAGSLEKIEKDEQRAASVSEDVAAIKEHLKKQLAKSAKA